MRRCVILIVFPLLLVLVGRTLAQEAGVLAPRAYLPLVYGSGTGPTQTSTPTTGNIRITINDPDNGQVVGNILPIRVSVQSLYQPLQVRAETEGRALDLTFSRGQWQGLLSLNGLAWGDHQLRITVTDDRGGTASKEVRFVYDLPPTVQVVAPLDKTVAWPEVHVQATCQDDNPAGCATITVRAGGCSATDPTVASGTTGVDTTISLAAYQDRQTLLCFLATDSRSQRSAAVRRTVFAESSPNLRQLAEVDGPILDVDANRILFVGADEHLIVHNRATRQETDIGITMRPNDRGFLTPRGAIVGDCSRFVQGRRVEGRVIEWRDGALVELARDTCVLKVGGDYALWLENESGVGYADVMGRDLQSGSTSKLAKDHHGLWGHDVNPDGEWAIGGPYARNPRKDDQITVYTFYNVAESNTDIVLRNGTNETVLSHDRSGFPDPNRHYDVRNGWVAFTRVFDGTAVWLRAPDGNEQYVSPGLVDRVAPNGDLAFLRGDRRYLRPLGQEPISVGGYFGGASRSLYLDGKWYIILGRSLFEVVDE